MQHWVTYPLAGPEFVSRRSLVRFATAAEAAGFDGIGFTDHPAPTRRWRRAGGHDTFDPFAALAFVAAVTERLRLIPNVCVLPYRNPFLVAKSIATIDVLSQGRFVLAAGSGYLRGEFKALGVDADERNELYDEAIHVLRHVWTTDDFTYEGRNFTAVGQSVSPAPRSRVPIWIGGNSARARQRVADAGDGWNPFRANATVARTARTRPLEQVSDLASLLDDLWRRVAAAGRDRADIDVAFGCAVGGTPGSDDFDAGAHLDALDALARIGVTWNAPEIPGDSLAHAIEALQRYGAEVIAEQRGPAPR